MIEWPTDLAPYNWDPRDPTRYDLVVNTSRIDIPTTVEVIVTASRGKTA